MKKIIVGIVALVVAIAMGVIVFGGGSANAASDVCVPSDAWTETVEHPAVYETVHHEAVTHVEYHFRKYTRTKVSHDGGKTWSDFSAWTAWVPETHTSWELSTEPLGAPAFHGKDLDGLDQWYREWQAQFDGLTRTVEDKAAWDEEILVSEAWTETIEHPEVVCNETPEKPAPLVTKTSSTSAKCGATFQVTTTLTTTTDYVWNESAEEWILGDPVTDKQVTKKRIKPSECKKGKIVVRIPCGMVLRPVADGKHIYIWEKCPVNKARKTAVPLIIDAGR